MTELADKLMQCYDSRELPSWYEIFDASTRLATLSRQLAEAQAVIQQVKDVCEDNIAAGRNAHMAINFILSVVREHAAAMGTQ
jgi:hypothetical protein